MGRYATRSVFATALCAGVLMVGASVNGMLGVDAELQRTALAAQQERTKESHSIRVTYREPKPDCGPEQSEPRSSHKA
ncbi:MAG TPA: hypothetical protein VNO82_08860 [Solirubrobacteraceae bacterium]|nr:hypothetical protein [Solirubrobacteraceae bacterium]